MTDTTEPEPGKAAGVIDWIVEVDARLLELESRTPADDPEADPEAQRLDRHRAEIEAIKRTLNELIEYVVAEGRAKEPRQLEPAPTIEGTYL